ncbi:MAG: IS1595 family transposase [Firmicutes bacterium]|jgi:hypothetical protein|nr:IS1595 family transposase [Bacillota bacterium]
MTLLQWQDKFSDEEACRQYLFDQYWPEGFVCLKCQGTKYWTVQRSGRTAPVYECAACGHQASVPAGTIFERTKVALRVWFLAIFLIAVDKGGKSALALSRELGLPYVTTWLLHHKIQQATAERNRRYKLGGLVELDDAYFGGVSQSPWHRPRMAQASVVGERIKTRSSSALASRAKAIRSMCFLEAVPDLKDPTVKKVLERRVETNGVWLTDGAPVYVSAAQEHQAEHKVTLSTDPQAEAVFHWVNIVISNAKAYIDGTFHGRGRARRQLYFGEFTYRFNRRYLGTGIADRLIVACLASKRHPYAT